MAFLLVLAAHISNPQGLFFKGSGKFGVWLFFALSAFLLSSYFLRRPSRVRSVREWANYGLRRIVRVYPLFLLVVGYLWCTDVLSLRAVMRHVTLREGWAHLWTIPVEMCFYAVLPVVVLCVVSVRRTWARLALLAAFIVVSQAIWPQREIPSNSVQVHWYLVVFLSGVGAAVVHTTLEQRAVRDGVRVAMDVVAALILGVVFLRLPTVWEWVFGSVNPRPYTEDLVLFALGWSAFIVCLLHGAGLVRRAFESGPLRWSGKIAYSGYLFHYLVIPKIAKHFGGFTPAAIISIIAITYAMASASYWLIERPSMRISILRHPKMR